MAHHGQAVGNLKAPSEMVPPDVGPLVGVHGPQSPQPRSGENNALCPGGRGLDPMSPLGSVSVLPTLTWCESQLLGPRLSPGPGALHLGANT